MVVRIAYDGGSSASANPLVIDEHSSVSGSLIRSISLSDRSTPFSMAATSGTEGVLLRSVDGRFVSLAGYRAPVGTPGVTGALGERLVARIDGAGSVDLTTVVADAYVRSGIRAAASVDGNQYWLAGNLAASVPDAGGGVRYVVQGSAGSTSAVLTDIANIMSVFVSSNGVVYASTAQPVPLPDGGSVGPVVLSLGMTPMSVSVPQRLPGVAVPEPQGFAVLDLSAAVPGDDTVYVTNNDVNGGVRRYSFNGQAWTQTARFLPGSPDGGPSSVSCTQVAAQQVGADVIVLCTTAEFSANRVVKFVDVQGASGNLSAGQTLTRAPPQQIYRGVAFSPR
jgi:hypothetical protein